LKHHAKTLGNIRELLKYIRTTLPTRAVLISGEVGWIRFLRTMGIKTSAYFCDVCDYVANNKVHGVKVGRIGGIRVMLIRRRAPISSRLKTSRDQAP